MKRWLTAPAWWQNVLLNLGIIAVGLGAICGYFALSHPQGAVRFAVYQDEARTVQLGEANPMQWGDLQAGMTATQMVYVQNTGAVGISVELTGSEYVASEVVILKPGQAKPLVATLTLPADLEAGHIILDTAFKVKVVKT